MVPPMEDDAITRARLELQRAEAALRDLPGEVGAHLAEVLQSVLAVRDGRVLAATLESIEHQVYGNWELCLSIDETCKAQVLPLVCDFEAKRLRIRYAVANGLDAASALNTAARLASGDYLSFAGE